ncbi:hypothetical protein HaLaN_08987, partial [Haematococcus lacustris]
GCNSSAACTPPPPPSAMTEPLRSHPLSTTELPASCSNLAAACTVPLSPAGCKPGPGWRSSTSSSKPSGSASTAMSKYCSVATNIGLLRVSLRMFAEHQCAA